MKNTQCRLARPELRRTPLHKLQQAVLRELGDVLCTLQALQAPARQKSNVRWPALQPIKDMCGLYANRQPLSALSGRVLAGQACGPWPEAKS